MKPKLEDLNRDALVLLLKKIWPQPTEHQIASAKWKEMNERAGRMMAAAREESDKYSGSLELLPKYMAAHKKFDEAQALYDEAAKYFDTYLVPKVTP